jgi:hypothetical protein
MSLDAVKKAEPIEKLAHGVKAKMRQMYRPRLGRLLVLTKKNAIQIARMAFMFSAASAYSPPCLIRMP